MEWLRWDILAILVTLGAVGFVLVVLFIHAARVDAADRRRTERDPAIFRDQATADVQARLRASQSSRIEPVRPWPPPPSDEDHARQARASRGGR